MVKGSLYGQDAPATEKKYSKQIRTRAQIPAQDSGKDTKPYEVESHLFQEEYQHYFLVDYKNNEAKEKLEPALKLLADEGIGADRTVGHGSFLRSGKDETIKLDSAEKIVLPSILAISVPSRRAFPQTFLRVAQLINCFAVEVG